MTQEDTSMSLATETTSPPRFDWQRWPRTETFLEGLIARALEGNAFAAELANRMKHETGTRFSDWVDHLVVEGSSALPATLVGLGYARQPLTHSVGVPVFGHAGGIFPRLAIVSSSQAADEEGIAAIREVAIKVESIAAFSSAHDLGLEILGYPLGPFRIGRLPGGRTSLAVVERRGYLGFDPFPGDLAREGRMKPHAARDAMSARDLWQSRKRRFDDDEAGFDATDTIRASPSANSIGLSRIHVPIWGSDFFAASVIQPP